jgi:uncharacterized protein involved in cysteine biosynthesis
MCSREFDLVSERVQQNQKPKQTHDKQKNSLANQFQNTMKGEKRKETPREKLA